jgi:hypothetical protein
VEARPPGTTLLGQRVLGVSAWGRTICCRKYMVVGYAESTLNAISNGVTIVV